MILNTWVLAMDGLMTDPTSITVLENFNLTFTIVFTIEMGLKLIGYGV